MADIVPSEAYMLPDEGTLPPIDLKTDPGGGKTYLISGDTFPRLVFHTFSPFPLIGKKIAHENLQKDPNVVFLYRLSGALER